LQFVQCTGFVVKPVHFSNLREHVYIHELCEVISGYNIKTQCSSLRILPENTEKIKSGGSFGNEHNK
jgi:hypothetical protein